MHLKYSGPHLDERTTNETNHRILVFHRYRYKGEDLNNKPYEDILCRVPKSYCDGWTIYLPNDFNRDIIDELIECFKDDVYLFPDNIQEITYINDEITRATTIYEYKYQDEYDEY